MSSDFKAVDWSYSTNIYEVNLRQYTYDGSFNAFAKELPRLKDMGIEIVWFMPVTPISVEKRKGTLGSYYACSDYTATNPEFGSMEEFISMVKTAHSLGMKVIIDWVANHTGWDHRWTISNPEYYARDEAGNFTERNGWDDVIDLDYNNPEMRSAMIAEMKWWITNGDIDGFRCDMAHLVVLNFWKEARAALQPLKPLFWLAECEEASYHEVFDATYTWKWMHKTEEFTRHQANLQDLWNTLQEYNSDFPADALRAYFTSNHDENTWNGTEYEKYGSAALNLAVFSCTWNGIPLIYSGQELPNLKRLKFFDKDPIEWTGHCALHDFYKTLLTLRKENPALRSGDPDVHTHRLQTTNEAVIFSYHRRHASGEIVVLLNFSSDRVSFKVVDGDLTGEYVNVFTKEKAVLSLQTEWILEPWSHILFSK